MCVLSLPNGQEDSTEDVCPMQQSASPATTKQIDEPSYGHSYDSSGRLTATAPAGITRGYDPEGYRTSFTDWSGSIKLFYDPFNEKEEGKGALCFFKSNMCWFRKRVSVRFFIPKEFYKRNA